jgi:DNA-binding NtrC family response regulator
MHTLLVDDDPQALERAAHLFEGAGFQVTRAESVDAGVAALDAGSVDLVLADDCMPEHPGAELIELITGRADAPPLILLGTHPTTPAVVRAMRAGAAGYLEKPLDVEELARAVEAALAGSALPGTFRDEDAPPLPEDPIPELVGVSTCIRNVKQLVRAAAGTTSPVFIQGPTGTGKELVASSIHRLSDRAGGPFIPVNCGALPEGLAESELFGTEKGAYTGAAQAREGLVQAAHGGTLFLDELGEMPLDLQVKLLRVLQEGKVRRVGGTQERPVDVRILAATNRDPEEAVARGNLREDLYYRLVVLRIAIAPLESRPEDIGPLANAFLVDLRERYGTGPSALSGPALEALRRYPWPGNVRELRNVLDLVFALGDAGETLELERLPERIRKTNPEGTEPPPPPQESGTAPSEPDAPLMALREAEFQMIKKALETSGGNKAKAARLLGISRQALYRRLEDLEIAEKR